MRCWSRYGISGKGVRNKPHVTMYIFCYFGWFDRTPKIWVRVQPGVPVISGNFFVITNGSSFSGRLHLNCKKKKRDNTSIFLNTFRQFVFVLVNVVTEIFGWMDFTGHCTYKENYLNRFDLKAKQNCSVLGLVPICKVSQRSLLISLFVSVFSKSFLFTLLSCTFQH